ncbi:MAG: hypothetical protein M1828_005538 [Chrysothrix sp. TS-e1954]|nr:MAG: hypothetical protein M1828_005538 [Chrysothrix sp. TS-e1954]
MPHSKTPGGQAASDKFKKQEAAKHGQGADNAPGHTEGKAPRERPVASDSGMNNVGIDRGTNQPGEKGLKDEIVGSEGNTGGQAQMKS